MHQYSLRRTLWVPHPLNTVFAFFAAAENLESITPPWMRFRILTPTPIVMQPGATISYALRVRGIPMRWLTEIESWDPPNQFVDVQAKGPYRLWRHRHEFFEVDGGTRILDTVDYSLPFGPFGRVAHRLLVARDLDAIFDYRQQEVQRLLRISEESSVSPQSKRITEI